jgi:hypothetical protein
MLLCHFGQHKLYIALRLRFAGLLAGGVILSVARLPHFPFLIRQSRSQSSVTMAGQISFSALMAFSKALPHREELRDA